MSFAAKKGMSDDASLSAVPREFPEDESFDNFVQSLRGDIEVARSDHRNRVDKELKLLFKLPTPILGLGVCLIDALNRYSLAPKALILLDEKGMNTF
ncbi:MAG: hypothetical protein GY811_08985 [Myxococcales bacterium]|nr:hypothetical protein [Myxococcales bacterium]